MLTQNFQTQLLRYFTQDPRGFSIVESVPLSTFDLADQQLVLDLLKVYRKRLKKGSMPSKVSLIQLLYQQENVPPELLPIIEQNVIDAFEPIDSGLDMYHATAVQLVQKKLCFDLMSNTAPALSGLPDAPEFNLDKVFNEMRRIVNLDTTTSMEHPISFLNDTPETVIMPKVHPTCIQGLNDLTSAGGFYSPQLIILMGGPKGFKTGLGINLAYGYLCDGLKIFLADYENGQAELYERLVQRMVYCTDLEVKRMDSVIRNNTTLQEIYESILNFLKRLGGDVRISSFSSFLHGVNEAEAQLEYLANEEDFVPDLAMWDYADLMAPRDRNNKEERFRVRDVYHNIISLNKSYKMFSISFSQVAKEAVRKKVIDLRDFAEAFNKAANCHAAFAICRTEEELEAGVGRLVPVVQRKGVRHDDKNEVYLTIEEAHQRCEELDLSANDIQDE